MRIGGYASIGLEAKIKIDHQDHGCTVDPQQIPEEPALRFHLGIISSSTKTTIWAAYLEVLS